jgi:hypothetical protein
MTLRRRLDDRTADALLSGRDVAGEPELSALLGAVRSLASGPVPEPSSALGALLAAGLGADALEQPTSGGFRLGSAVSWRRRTWALPLQLTAAGVACLAVVVGAAAGNELPAPAQTAVADVVEAVTPLHVPRPQDHPAPAVVPSSTPSAEPSERPDATPTPHATRSPQPEKTSGRHGGSGSDPRPGDGEDSSRGHDPRATQAPEQHTDRTSGGDQPQPTATPTSADQRDGGGSPDGGGDSGSGSVSLSGSGSGDHPAEPDR